MSEIKTLAQKMDIGRYGKLGNGIPKFSSPAAAGARQNRVFDYTGDFCYTYWERHPGGTWPCAVPKASRDYKEAEGEALMNEVSSLVPVSAVPV